MPTTLLFPGGMPESIARLHALAQMGERCIGASSLVNDPAQPLYPSYVHLPYVTQPAFEASFLALIESHHITHVFTRHPIVRRYLEALITKHQLPITLDVARFTGVSIEQQQSIFARVDQLLAMPISLEIADEEPPLSRLAMASMLMHCLRVEGQSSDEKLFALYEIFRSMPKGDIIEIGSFWGRSAVMLAMLARHFDTGALLCIDPWENNAALQAGVAEFVNDETREIDFTSALEGFLLNIFPYHAGRVNFMKSDAHHAHALYTAPGSVSSEPFGITHYTGHIACLHIDGNHALPHIRQDIDDWVPHVVPGGWIIIDDYQWAFGDGPQIAADAWLNANIQRIARAFVTGSALFIKLIAA